MTSNRLTSSYKSALIITLFACLLYANTIKHGFVFDDTAVLTGNTYVKQGLDGLPKIFAEGSWEGYEPDSDMHIYRPLQLMVLAIQYELFELNPLGYHMVHVLSYALLCFLVLRLLQSLFAKHEKGKLLAFLATLLFAAHPVHTEVVANIKGNGDLLAMLFGVLSLSCLHSYSEEAKSTLARTVMLILGAFCFLLALLTKETIVSFVGVAAFLLYFFSELSIKRILLSILPMLVMVGLYLSLRAWVFGEDSNTLTDTSQYSNVILLTDSFSQNIGTRLWALGKNLQLLTLPYPLVVMYVYNSVPLVELWDIRAIFALAAYIVLGIALLYNLKRGSIWGFALAFFFTTLALFANIVFSIPNIVSERWLLIPSLGVCIAIAYALLKLHALSPKAAIGTLALLLLGYAGYTIERNRAWESNLTLGLTDVKTAPQSVIVNRMIARSLHAAAVENNMDKEQLRGVAEAYKRLLQDAPNDASIYLKLAKTYDQLGEHRLAAETYGKSASYISPSKEPAQRGYLSNLLKTEQYPRAAEFIRTNKLTDNLAPDMLKDAVIAHAGAGEMGEANAHFQNLAEILANTTTSADSSNQLTLNSLGIALENLNAHSLAARAFAQAASAPSTIQGKARFSEAKNLNLAGHYEEAIFRWEALEADYPTLLDVTAGKITALAGAGKDEAAREEYDRYLTRLKGTSTDVAATLNNLGLALEKSQAHAIAATAFNDAADNADNADTSSNIKGRARFSAVKNLNIAHLYEDALPKWRAIRTDYPDLIIPIMGEAESLEALGEEAQARQAYQLVLDRIQAQDAHWSQATLRRQAEAALQALKDSSQAFYDAQMALIEQKQAAQPDAPIHNDLNILAVMLEKKGAHDLAAQIFGQIAALDSPLKGKALYAEANNLNLAGDYAQAAPKWQILDKTYPNLVDVLIGSAEAHEAIGDNATAKTNYQQALRLITPKNMNERYAAFKKLAESKLSIK